MISVKLQIVLFVCIIIYLLLVWRLLRVGNLILKYSLLWILLGLFLGILVLAPKLLKRFAAVLGIYSDINFLFLALIGFAIAIILSLTVIVSRMNSRNRELIEQAALIEKRVRELEEKIEISEKDDIRKRNS